MCSSYLACAVLLAIHGPLGQIRTKDIGPGYKSYNKKKQKKAHGEWQVVQGMNLRK